MSNATTKALKTKRPKKPRSSPKQPIVVTPPPITADISPSIAEPKAHWNPLLGVILAVVIFFGAQVISGVFLSYYRYPKHWTNQQLLNWLTNSITAQFLYVLIAEALIILGVYLFVSRYKDGLRAIGIRRPRWSDPFYALAGLPLYLGAYLVAVAVLAHLIPSLNVNEKQQLGFNNVSGTRELIMTFLSLVILPPIAEEILFRGFVYTSLKKNLPVVVAVIGTSALFAIGHLPEGGSAGPLYIAAIDTFILSLVLILLREKTGGLWASMTLHALKNGIAFVYLFAAVIR
jgi:membrane protease YdiL (CAAX protease family)